MLGVFAEFETNLRREWQLEGIAKAKAAGVYKGRPASIDAAKVRELKAQDIGAAKSREYLVSAERRSIECWSPLDNQKWLHRAIRRHPEKRISGLPLGIASQLAPWPLRRARARSLQRLADE